MELHRRCRARRICERLEREHRRRDLTGGRIGDRRRGAFEHQQPRIRDLARERFAVVPGDRDGRGDPGMTEPDLTSAADGLKDADKRGVL